LITSGENVELFIVSGRSGSGKSVALRVLEDLGCYCVDNLPLELLSQLPEILPSHYQKAAVSIDVRNLPHDPAVLESVMLALKPKVKLTSLFVDADEAVLIRRYSETRRLHPLNRENYSLTEAIRAETSRLEPLSCNADLRIDTTSLSIHQLSELIRERVLGKKSQELTLVFESFGFKNGVPKDVDYVFDARFLPNPHWIPELRAFTGQQSQVVEYLSKQPLVPEFIWQIESMLTSWLPHLERNNRAYVTVAIGCTGGKHRSVYVTEQLAQHFSNKYRVQLRHLNLPQPPPEKDHDRNP
jgi:UPF0042 nucleotide-binding protein